MTAGEYARWLMPWMGLTFLAVPLSYLIDIRRKLGEFLVYNLVFFLAILGVIQFAPSSWDDLQLIQALGATGAALVALQLGYLLWLGSNNEGMRE